ncbi:Homoserine dehydrogenase [uncultured delta proteobacterium]|uniref:Homoserine dehydrogenase n=1 Tax=uncultured delta proteobacterium TaxID=34034 RepID=A0A212IVD2_9DELT|nr:Homoserine dehydrogenase [uncultured delta proteobacterium]
MNKKTLVVGLAGYGVVGTGFARALEENRELIRRRTGCDIVIKTVVAKESENELAHPLPKGAVLSHDIDTICTDPEIDLGIELMGGTGIAAKFLRKCLENGKHAVTANKALLAEDGLDLFRIAGEKNLYLGYEASVCGGIPIVQAMREGLAGNRILSLSGILNGTCNYILSAMTAKGQSFTDALKDAQRLGFAEADPTLDIEGLDAAHKLVLLIRLAWGAEYPFKSLPVRGISKVGAEDIGFARELGYRIKLLGQARLADGKIEAGVFPTLVHESSMLAKVDGSFNAVWAKGNAVGTVFMHGRGAGDLPTGSAVLSDVMAVARGAVPNNTGFVAQEPQKADLLCPSQAESKHYFRLMVPDRPGVLRDVAGILAENGMSIAQAIQKGEEEIVPLVFMTHLAKAQSVENAIKTLRDRDLLRAEPVSYRVLAHE